MMKDRFKFKTIAENSKIYLVQRTVWESKDYYIILWQADNFEAHDTGIECYVWEVDEVDKNIAKGYWIIVD